MGGLWRQIEWEALREVQKVKAHVDVEVAEKEGWLRSWRGNQEADSVARKAAQVDRLSIESLQLLGRERTLQAKFLTAAAKMFAQWPAVELSGLTRARRAAGPPASGRPRQAKASHCYEWIQHLACWRCKNCWHCKRCSRHPHDKATCKAVPEWVGKVLPEFNHKLHMVDAGRAKQPLIFCTRCGAFSECRLMHLGKPCRGAGFGSHKLFLATIARGKHPKWRKVMLGRPWPIILRASEPEEGIAPDVAEMVAQGEGEQAQDEDQEPILEEEGDWSLEEQAGFFGDF
jgi:hypothetical protein